MNFVVECGRDFIMAFKENRKVALSKEDKLLGKYKYQRGCVRRVCPASLC
jgi:hypothetical protein